MKTVSYILSKIEKNRKSSCLDLNVSQGDQRRR